MADSFTLLIPDSSPQLSYFPFADTLSIPNFFGGWNPCFSTSACPTFPSEQGNGTSFHVTSRDQAAFSIQWWGNGIKLSGFALGPITYDLQLDGITNSSISPPTGTTLLAAYDELPPGEHTLSLIVHNPANSSSALIAIDNASIAINSTLSNVTFSSTVIEDTLLPFTGQWSFLNDSSFSSLDSSYHTTTHAGDFLKYNFSGTAITVFGFRDATSGEFSVQLDNDSIILDGASSSRDATTLFFKTGLNNSVPHTLTITNAEDRLLAIGSINITIASSSSSGSSSHVSRGSIAAIVVASILGALVLLIAAYFLWCRRRKFRSILHRKRLFVAPNGNDHSKVLDIVRGPEDDDFDDMYEEKSPVDKSRHGTIDGSGSLSFTLDLPIQSRPSLPPSQRDYSGNSAQDLPRSPTISLGRPGTHARESSRGIPLHEISNGDGTDSGEMGRPPSSVAMGQATNEGARASLLPRDQEMAEQTEGRAFELTPIQPVPPLPRPRVSTSGPAQGGSDQSQPSYSFLDIGGSSQVSFASVRHPSHGASTSSSSSGSMRRRSDEPFSSARRISLPFAMGYHRDLLTGSRDRPSVSRPPSTSVEFPRFSLNIRPLPRIPLSAVERVSESSIRPMFPRRAVRQHTQSTPPLHVETGFAEPQNLPRSVSTTTAPPASTLSGATQVPHIIIHPSSLTRPHLRSSSIVSPTESVPVTVSDIHFRHSSDDEPGEEESRRASIGVGEHPPPHPPLPQRSYTSPFIMHKLFGTPAPPPRGPHPLQTPGAGPSRLRDHDPSPEGSSSSGSQTKRTS
ncbi:hypothetical protein F5148DRAFT_46156 [Russula earlei]|uniref:Uncharacterized protein n=1 Tax=Russula earlei TaxID=71964 RepID=A0ACC0U8D7_9AGAM|nr:hypothetical protein F5148DRAFT_46156 [Russula earlei]